MGGSAPDVPGLRVREEAWSEEAEKRFLAEVDIGLMPLPDNAWTRGKCAYKALQYMAAGIPVVADDVGVSAEVIGHEQGGLIVPAGGDWAEPLRTLGFRRRLLRTSSATPAASASPRATRSRPGHRPWRGFCAENR